MFTLTDITISELRASLARCQDLLGPAAGIPEPGPARMHVFAYGDYSIEMQATLLAARPQTVILNTPSGFWGHNYGAAAQCFDSQAVARLKAAGIKVLGYTTSGYAGKGSAGHRRAFVSLDNVMRQVTDMSVLDGVDGVFLDEVDSYPKASDRQYYSIVCKGSRDHELVVWANPGVNNVDEWLFGQFDMVHCSEIWQAGQAVSPVMARHTLQVAVAGYGPSWTLESARAAMRDAYSKGIASAYCGAASWTALPPFLRELADGFR